MTPSKSNRFKAFALLLTLTACEYTEADNPKDGPCGKRCEGELFYCHPELKACVACTEDAHCEGNAAGPLCEKSTGTCLACLENADCANGATCDMDTKTCVNTCEEHADCAGVLGKEACGPEGVCVECTPDNEAGCSGKVCEPDTLECSESIGQKSAGSCRSCISDSQCIDDYKCVPMQYQSSAHGNYCLKLRGPGCVEPYRIELDRTSLNSTQSETFCGINETLTTCEAILAFNAECDEDGKCIIDDIEVEVPGAICKPTAVPNRCTYYCQDDLQCFPSAPCPDPGNQEDLYCGG